MADRCAKCRKRKVRPLSEVMDEVNEDTTGLWGGSTEEEMRTGLIRVFLISCAELGGQCPSCAELAAMNVELKHLFESGGGHG